MKNVFKDKISRLGFLKLLALCIVGLHFLAYVLNALAGWTSLSEQYGNKLGGHALDFFGLLFPTMAAGALWQILVVAWLVALVICTVGFIKRLRDVGFPAYLFVTFPIFVSWITWVGFGPYNTFLENGSLWWVVFVIWASGLLTLATTLLPSKK